MMTSWKHTAQLLSKSLLAKDTYELTLGINSGNFIFKAGQYVWVILPELSFPDPKGNRWAYSIASSNKDKSKVLIILRDTGSGYKKSLLALSEGSNLEIQGPFGSAFVLEDNPDKNSIIIAGGTGIAPFLSIVRSHAFNSDQKLALIFVNSSEEKSFLTEELTKLTSETHTAFIKVIGRFDWNNIPTNFPIEDSRFYVSGPRAMVDSVVPILLKHKAKSESMVFEQNYPNFPGDLTLKDIEKFMADKNTIGHKVIEQSNQHIIITDANGVVLYANQAAEEITGYTKEEMVGNTPRLWGGLMSSEFYKDFWEKKPTKESYVGEITNRRKNGKIYKTQSHVSPIQDRNGSVIAYVATEEDITERVELAYKLEKHRKKLIEEAARDEAIFRSIGEGMIIVGRRGEIVFVNDGFEKLLGLSRNEVIGKKMADVVPKYDEKDTLIPKEKRSIERVLAGEIQSGSVSTLAKTHYYLKKDGDKLYIIGTVTPIVVDKRVIGAVQIFRNIGREKELDRLKDEFLAIASHELRTPLAAIDGIIAMVRGGEYGQVSSEVRGALDDVNTASERLIKLVNDLLSLSRIKAGRLKYNLTVFNINNLLTEIFDLYTPIAQKKELVFKLYDNPVVEVQADADKVKEILGNLLANSFEFTKKGEINISSLLADDLVKVYVTDTGSGIEKKDLELLFGKFQQVGVKNGQHEGTGLGLHIAREMVRKMGGDMWLEKSEVGQGSVFAFSLPLKDSVKAETAKKALAEESLMNSD